MNGHSAVLTAVLEWWAESHGIRHQALALAGTLPPHSFKSFHFKDVGEVLCRSRDFCSEFWSVVDGNPTTRWLLSHVPGSQKRDMLEKLAREQICWDLGRFVRSSQWWMDHEEQIDRERSDIRRVREVLDT